MTDSDCVGAAPESDGTRGGSRLPSAPPPNVPPSQAYFWTEEWQAEERAAEEAYETGDVVRFQNAADAARWLLSADEDEDSSG